LGGTEITLQHPVPTESNSGEALDCASVAARVSSVATTDC
jgi:hypothetical protein